MVRDSSAHRVMVTAHGGCDIFLACENFGGDSTNHSQPVLFFLFFLRGERRSARVH